MAVGSVLEVRDLSVSVERGDRTAVAVDDVSFAVAPGECLGIVGESGSGKSLALRAAMGLLPAGASLLRGSVRVSDGAVQTRTDGPPRGLAMVFQDSFAALDPTMRVGAFLAETIRRHRRTTRRQARRHMIDALVDVGMPNPQRCARAYPGELSGGQRQRATIALALATEPQVLLCDEPTTALDVTLQAKILALLRAKQADSGLGMVFVSHDIAVVQQIADVVAVMYAGRIIEIGDVRKVIDEPMHPYTKGLVDSSPDIDHPRERFVAIAGTPPDPGEYQERCRFFDRCVHANDDCNVPLNGLDGTNTSHRSDCVRAHELAISGRRP